MVVEKVDVNMCENEIKPYLLSWIKPLNEIKPYLNQLQMDQRI